MSADAFASPIDLADVEADAERVLQGVRSLPQNPFNTSAAKSKPRRENLRIDTQLRSGSCSPREIPQSHSNQDSHDEPSLLQAVAAGSSAADSVRLDSTAQDEMRLNELLANHDRYHRPSLSAQTSQVVRYQQEKQMEIEEMISQARKALEHGVASVSGVRQGAALLTRLGMVFTGCNIESSAGTMFTSAPRMALLKAIAEGQSTFERMVVVSEGSKEEFPWIDPVSIDAMAQHGDFDVVLVKNDENQSKLKTTTYELLPPTVRSHMAQESTWKFPAYWDNAMRDRASSVSPSRRRIAAERRRGYRSKPILEWTTRDVVNWVDEECDLPSYVQAFRESRINGKLLLGLNKLDMEEMLGIYHPLHLRRLTAAIDRLRQEEMAQTVPGSPVRQTRRGLSDESITLIVQLKEEFDKESSSPQDTVTLEQLVRMLQNLSKEVEVSRIHDWVTLHAAAAEELNFHQIVALSMDLSLAPRSSARTNLVVDKNGHVICKENNMYHSWLAQQQLNQGKNVLDSARQNQGDYEDEDASTRRRNILARHNQLDEKEFSRLQRLFNREDNDCCGHLLRSEAARAISKTGIKVSSAEFGQYLRVQGLDSSAKVDLFEFARAYMHFASKKGVVVATELHAGTDSKLLRAISVSPRHSTSIRRDISPSSRTLLGSLDRSSYSKHMKRARRRFKYQNSYASSTKDSSEESSSSSSSSSASSLYSSPTDLQSSSASSESSEEERRSRRGRSRSKHRHSSKLKHSSLIKRRRGYMRSPAKKRRRRKSRSRSKHKRKPKTNRRVLIAFNKFQKSHVSAIEAKDLLVSIGLDVKRQHVSEFLRRFKRNKTSLRLNDVQELYEWITAGGPDRGEQVKDTDSSDPESEMSSGATDKFIVGESVEARNYSEDSTFEKATILHGNSNGTFALRFDGGEKQRETRLKDIRRHRLNTSLVIRVKHHKGEVLRIHSDDTVDVQFNNGKRSKRVPCKQVRVFTEDQESSSSQTTNKRTSRSRSLARAKGRSESLASDDEDVRTKCKAKFFKGEEVEARFRGKKQFHKGRVSCVHTDGTYDIDYDDGDRERRVAPSLMRKVVEDASDTSDGISVGDRVEARFKGKSKYYKGKITRAHADGTFDILYDDGDSERRVRPSLIKPLPGAARRFSGTDNSSESETNQVRRDRRKDTSSCSSEGEVELSKGDKVEARYKGKAKYYRGTITRVNDDGTFDIRYDDGDRETRVRQALIKPLQEANLKRTGTRARSRSKSKTRGGVSDDEDASGSDEDALRQGQKVEARYKGKTKYYAGVITRVNRDGTFDIRYDDGDKERGVRRTLIKAAERSSTRKTRSSGRTHVHRTRNRSPCDGNSESDASESSLLQGQKVEARYKGKAKYYAGVITRVNRDGTFDIRYDDGDRESAVRRSFIRGTKQKNPRSRQRSRSGSKSRRDHRAEDDGNSSDPDAEELCQGQHVEARYKGKSKYYSGIITRVYRDGTYDIRYDDGDKESRVKRSFIKPKESDRKRSLRGRRSARSRSKNSVTLSDDEEGGSLSDTDELRQGQKIEARYRGKSKYYSGVITKVNRDGTFDIRYDDGDKESGVRRALIKEPTDSSRRSPGSGRRLHGRSRRGDEGRDLDVDRRGSDSDAQDGQLRQGQKVEARYKGKAKYYSGVITKANRDGTFDIRYDDGDRESRVRRSLIKAKLTSSKRESSPRGLSHASRKAAFSDEDEGSASDGSLRQGQKVEARYKGKSKYYAGVITKANRNGTYDIRYDDGDREAGVRRSYIKIPGASRTASPRRATRSRSRSKSRNAHSDEEEEGEEDSAAEEMTIRQGQKVEARYKGKTKYYSGVVTKVNRNGTFDIRYDDGDRESGVRRRLIKVSPAAIDSGSRKDTRSRSRSKSRHVPSDEEQDSPAEEQSIRQGQKVEARYGGKAKYYHGVVTKVNRNGTFDIRYDDGDRESGVRRSLIKVLDGADGAMRSRSRSKSKNSRSDEEDELTSDEEPISQGQKVEARYKGKAKYYSGVVTKVNRDGTFNIRYDDGDRESNVKRTFIKVKEQVRRSSPRRRGRSPRSYNRKSFTNEDEEEDEDADDTGDLRPGQVVEARFKGKAKYYTGKILRARGNGTYDIKYDDGDVEYGVRKQLIRTSSKVTQRSDGSSEERAPFEIGDEIEARYRGKAKYYAGVITRVNQDNSVDIRYSDGDRETRVRPSLVRRKDNPRGPKSGRSRSRSQAKNGGSSGESDGELEAEVEVGDKVEAKYKGKSKFYAGVVTRRNRDGTVDIRYDDGDRETGVDMSLVRPLRPSNAQRTSSPRQRHSTTRGQNTNRRGQVDSEGDDEDQPEEFLVGDGVEARYKGKSKYFAGMITKVNGDGTFNIRYNDGDVERGVRRGLIRKKSKESLKETLRRGDEVEARFKGKSKFYAGKILRSNADGTYDIRYADGDMERGVKRNLIKKKSKSLDRQVDQDSSVVSEDEDNSAKSFRRGDAIEARFKGKARYFNGSIIRVNPGGTFDIRYNDGDEEFGVRPGLIRKPRSSPRQRASSSRSPRRGSVASDDEAYSVGDKVEARFQGKSKYYSGSIIRCNVDGTFDIEYDDGDKERRVRAALIRKKSVDQSNGSHSHSARRNRQGIDQSFEKGDLVEARFKGKSKYYKGKVVAVRGDGTYAIRYEDGDLETNVEASMIRIAHKKESRDSSQSRGEIDFEVGDQVQARYRGKAKYYGAVITNVNRDGTFNLRYDDGETELKVKPHFVRKVSSADVEHGSSDFSDPEDAGISSTVFREGEEVEARFKGKSKFYSGRILRVRGRNAYDIRYNDGDIERNVDVSLIRRVGTSEDDYDKTGFEPGDAIEARFRGKAKYFSGKIQKRNRDGTYQVKYDDGDIEHRVRQDLIRKCGNQAEGRQVRGTLKEEPDVGDKVQARYRGKSKYFSGVITKRNRDGTFSIRYDDGDVETRVDPSLIRVRPGEDNDDRDQMHDSEDPSDEHSHKFERGEAVEARFKGKAKYYPGRVLRVKPSGACDIRYNDGDTERDVRPSLIRKLSTTSSPRRTREGSNHNLASDDSDFSVGDEVEARFRGKSKFFAGKITRRNRDGSYNVRYNDGDVESNVASHLIRRSQASIKRNSSRQMNVESSDSEAEERFQRGERIEARFKGKAKFFKGKITAVNSDGTYNIRYDDGDTEYDVKPALIRKDGPSERRRASQRSESPRRSGHDRFDIEDEDIAVGDEVEARFRGNNKWYPGVVEKENLDGTFDIMYDDGDLDRSVKRSFVRKKARTSGANTLRQRSKSPRKPSSPRRFPTGSDEDKGQFSRGDIVEARFKGKARFYRGKIFRVKDNGTYDIRYDDGDTEINVDPALIRYPSRK